MPSITNCYSRTTTNNLTKEFEVKSFKTQMLLIAVSIVSVSLAQAEEKLKVDREAVNNACSQEATTAGCPDLKVGKGLLKCFKEYHSKHSDFKPGAGCDDALKKLRADRKEMHKEKRAMKHQEKAEEKKDTK